MGPPIATLAMGIDITGRKQAEFRIQHLNRVYAVLTDVNQAIVREKDPPTMFAAACRIAVEKGGFRLAWIGMLDPPSHHLQIKAYAEADGGTLEILNALIEADPPGGSSFIWRALHTGQREICNDIANDPQTALWPGSALERNYRSMAAFPLKVGRLVIGTFNLYSGEDNFFDAEDCVCSRSCRWTSLSRSKFTIATCSGNGPKKTCALAKSVFAKWSKTSTKSSGSLIPSRIRCST